MTWFKVDDSLAGHPKPRRAGKQAMGLWVIAGSWCAQQLTNGVVPTHMLALLGGSAKDAKELVGSGLWEVHPDGWEFHDWASYQPSRDQVEADRKAAKERQRRAREKAASRRESRRDEGVTHGTVTPLVTVPPTRPDPTKETTGAKDGATKRIDPIWDALMAACDIDPKSITDSARGPYNKAAKDLRGIEATPAQITLRGRRFHQQWPGVTITPTALVRRWSELNGAGPDKGQRAVEQ